jgi:hypothetical protein
VEFFFLSTVTKSAGGLVVAGSWELRASEVLAGIPVCARVIPNPKYHGDFKPTDFTFVGSWAANAPVDADSAITDKTPTTYLFNRASTWLCRQTAAFVPECRKEVNQLARALG